MGFPHSSDGKESACNAGDPGLSPGLGRSCGEGNGNPLQYSCLENPIDGGAWWATVHGVAKSQTQFSTEGTTTNSSIEAFFFSIFYFIFNFSFVEGLTNETKR